MNNFYPKLTMTEHYDSLLGFAKTKLPTIEDAEDVVQNTYLNYLKYNYDKSDVRRCLFFVLKQEIYRFYNPKSGRNKRKREITYSLDEDWQNIEQKGDRSYKMNFYTLGDGGLSYDKNVLEKHLQMPRPDKSRHKWIFYQNDFKKLYLSANTKPYKFAFLTSYISEDKSKNRTVTSKGIHQLIKGVFGRCNISNR